MKTTIIVKEVISKEDIKGNKKDKSTDHKFLNATYMLSGNFLVIIEEDKGVNIRTPFNLDNIMEWGFKNNEDDL